MNPAWRSRMATSSWFTGDTPAGDQSRWSPSISSASWTAKWWNTGMCCRRKSPPPIQRAATPCSQYASELCPSELSEWSEYPVTSQNGRRLLQQVAYWYEPTGDPKQGRRSVCQGSGRMSSSLPRSDHNRLRPWGPIVDAGLVSHLHVSDASSIPSVWRAPASFSVLRLESACGMADRITKLASAPALLVSVSIRSLSMANYQL